MKPFNLERFLDGDPVVCRDGTAPEDLHYFAKAGQTEARIVGVINERLCSWFDNGKYIRSTKECGADLMMAPRTVEKWVWVWPTNQAGSPLFDSMEDLQAEYSECVGHPARVTWEE